MYTLAIVCHSHPLPPDCTLNLHFTPRLQSTVFISHWPLFLDSLGSVYPLALSNLTRWHLLWGQFDWGKQFYSFILNYHFRVLDRSILREQMDSLFTIHGTVCILMVCSVQSAVSNRQDCQSAVRSPQSVVHSPHFVFDLQLSGRYSQIPLTRWRRAF